MLLTIEAISPSFVWNRSFFGLSLYFLNTCNSHPFQGAVAMSAMLAAAASHSRSSTSITRAAASNASFAVQYCGGSMSVKNCGLYKIVFSLLMSWYTLWWSTTSMLVFCSNCLIVSGSWSGLKSQVIRCVIFLLCICFMFSCVIPFVLRSSGVWRSIGLLRSRCIAFAIITAELIPSLSLSWIMQTLSSGVMSVKNLSTRDRSSSLFIMLMASGRECKLARE